MERKEGIVKKGCLKILWAVMAVLLCAVPCSAIDVEDGQTLEVTSNIIYEYEFVTVKSGGTLIVKPGAVIFAVAAQPGSTVDIYGGIITYGIEVSPDTPDPVITVYGTGFADSSGSISTTQWTPVGGSDTLTGTYENSTPISLLFTSNTPINLVDTAGGTGPEPITIDIKPGSFPNAINLGSNGVIPVAILSTPGFIATDLNPDTVFLAGSGVAVRGKGSKLLASEEDVNGDSLLDLVVKVETENLDPGTFQDGSAILQVIVGGIVIYEGSDSITIVPPE